MTTDAATARDDLAYLRTLFGSADILPGFGEGYFAAGLIYGAQMLLHVAQALGWTPSSGLLDLGIGLGPTAVFIPLICWINWRHRQDRPSTAVGRAVGGVFAAVGLSNVVLAAAIGMVAWREQSLTTWLIYPCVVFALQGAAWFVTALMRRRAWMWAVVAGWWACAIAMAASVQTIFVYVAVAGVGIWLCMALPGWVMIRQGRPAAAGGVAPAAATP